MARINVKLNDVESGFPLLEEDWYAIEIAETSKLTVAKDNSGLIRWIGKILEGPHEGKFVGWNCSLKEQALWNLKQMLEACGFEWDEDGFDTDDVVGAQLLVHNTPREIEEGVRKGELANSIDAYKPIG